MSTFGSLGAGIPIVLGGTEYARDFEREADACAIDAMDCMAIPPTRLAWLLERLAGSHGDADPGEDGWTDLLSTHPGTDAPRLNCPLPLAVTRLIAWMRLVAPGNGIV